MTDTSSASTPAKTAGPSKRQRGREKHTPTRKVQLINLLSRRNGADVTVISAAFGWQPHTTRAALSGLRKAGYMVIRSTSRTGKPARYRISQASREKTAHASVKEEAANAG